MCQSRCANGYPSEGTTCACSQLWWVLKLKQLMQVHHTCRLHHGYSDGLQVITSSTEGSCPRYVRSCAPQSPPRPSQSRRHGPSVPDAERRVAQPEVGTNIVIGREAPPPYPRRTLRDERNTSQGALIAGSRRPPFSANWRLPRDHSPAARRGATRVTEPAALRCSMSLGPRRSRG